jgi:cytochrome c oxidase subunit 4
MLSTEKIAPSMTLVLTCVALLILTLVNIGLAMVDLRGWNTIVGLLIAATQALISVLFLMHLRWSRPVVRLVGVIALLWLGILIAGTMDDILTRGWLPIPGK